LDLDFAENDGENNFIRELDGKNLFILILI